MPLAQFNVYNLNDRLQSIKKKVFSKRMSESDISNSCWWSFITACWSNFSCQSLTSPKFSLELPAWCSAKQPPQLSITGCVSITRPPLTVIGRPADTLDNAEKLHSCKRNVKVKGTDRSPPHSSSSTEESAPRGTVCARLSLWVWERNMYCKLCPVNACLN